MTNEQPPFNLNEFLYKTVDGSTWTVPDAESFDFASFFAWMTDIRQLLVHRDELNWMERSIRPDHPVDVFVNLSCGTQLAPHLTLDSVAVLQALGVDFVAASGRQFCCGKIYMTHGRTDAGRDMTGASLARFASWGATMAVHGCPSCQLVYSDRVANDVEAPEGFRNQHYSAFLEARLIELGDRVPWRKRIDARILVEGHGEKLSPVHAAATEAAARMLAMVPGVEVLGVVEPPARGAPCKTGSPGGPSILADVSVEERAAIQAELEAQAARRGGATLIAPGSAGCLREWGKFATERLAVRHYISIIADALGVASPDRFQDLWRLGDPEAVVRETRPLWESWQLPEPRAREIAYKHFDPHFAGFVNPACACGGDPEKCTTGRFTLANDIPGAAAGHHHPERGHQPQA